MTDTTDCTVAPADTTCGQKASVWLWQRLLTSPLSFRQWQSTPIPWQIPACAVFVAFVWALSGWAPLVLATGIIGTGILGVVVSRQKRRADQ